MKLIAKTSGKDPALVDILDDDRLLLRLDEGELAELRLFLMAVQDMQGIDCPFEISMEWD